MDTSGEITVKCLDCSDTGYVSCFHAVTMQHAINHVKGMCDYEFLWRKFSTAAIPCAKCRKGDLMAQATCFASKRLRGDDRMPIRSDDHRLVKVPTQLCQTEQLETLLRWAEGYVGDLDERNAARDGMTAGSVFEVP